MEFTVNEFSDRTGLPASTLRFYDGKQLLVPAKRQPNGYRVYTEEQISEALLIHSLRQADVPMEDIRHYLRVGEVERNVFLQKWRREIEAKLAKVQIAKLYLDGIRPDETSVKLLRWEEPSVMVWFRHTVPRRTDPFAAEREQDLRFLERLGVSLNRGIYVRSLEARGGHITGEVGFRIAAGRQQQVPDFDQAPNEITVTQVASTLFVTMDCLAGNDFLCFDFIHLLRKYGFSAAGTPWERYDPDIKGMFQMLIPVASERSSEA